MAARSGMRTFFIVWLGQLVSLIGSGLTSFALAVWIYQETGQATPFALTVLLGNLPRILLASLGMAAVLFGMAELLDPLIEARGWLRLLALGLLVPTGLVAYGALGLLLGAFEHADFRKALSRKAA